MPNDGEHGESKAEIPSKHFSREKVFTRSVMGLSNVFVFHKDIQAGVR
jgi:hypothetical protein